MNKGLKLVPFALAALLLVGCSSKVIGPQNGKNPIINENTLSYQEYYDQMFEKHNGSERAAKELILRVAKDVVKNSEHFVNYEYEGKKGYEALVKEREDMILDAFYTSSYKKNGYFQEDLLVEDLRNQGYDIKDPANGEEGFEEDFDNLLGYTKLHTVLKYDYSNYIEKKAEYDIYLQLLKEEYILTEKANYFQDKRIRKVQYFKYTPSTTSEAETIRKNIEDKLDETLNEKNGVLSEGDFRDLSHEFFQTYVDDVNLDKAAKDYAIINDSQNKDEREEKYTGKFLLDKYLNEAEYKNLTDKQKEEVKTAYNSYTNNGVYTKEFGYELKKIEAKSNLGYAEGYLSSDDSTTSVVNSEIDTLIKKPKLEDHIITHKVGENDVKTNLLDATGSGSKVFKNESSYYVVRVEEINDKTENANDKVDGASALTKNTTNVKNAVAFYLEKNNVNIYEETLYNYLKDTFGFDKNKK